MKAHDWLKNLRFKIPSGRAVLSILCDYADNSGICYPSINTISQASGLTRRTVITAISKLCEAGYIQKQGELYENNGYKNNTYTLNLDNIIMTPSVNSTLPPSVKITPPLVQNLHPNTVNNNTKKNIQKKISRPELQPDKLDADFERFWEAYPKRIGGSPKKPSKQKFMLIIKNKIATAEQMIAGAQAYANHLVKTGKANTEYVKQATTWLNGECWNNEISATPQRPERQLTRPEDIAQPQGIGKSNYQIYLEKKRQQAA
jgi:hypothetical protein